MVEFEFDAHELSKRGLKPSWGPPPEGILHGTPEAEGYDTPEEYALRMWHAAEVDMDFDMTCEMAAVDGAIHKQLWEWAVKAEGLHDDRKLQLFTALVRKRPAILKEKTKRKNHIRSIAKLMKHYYPILTRDKIEVILAEIVGLDKQSVSNMLPPLGDP